jgi:hypothetical protein
MRLSRRPEKKLVKKTRIYGIAMQVAVRQSPKILFSAEAQT